MTGTAVLLFVRPILRHRGRFAQSGERRWRVEEKWRCLIRHRRCRRA
jgi:hypothetical protein